MSEAKIFTGLSTVAIPVTDQERSKSLFEALGFECSFDGELQARFRWIELAPSGASTSVALVAAGADLPPGVDTGIRLIATDARAAEQALPAVTVHTVESPSDTARSGYLDPGAPPVPWLRPNETNDQ